MQVLASEWSERGFHLNNIEDLSGFLGKEGDWIVVPHVNEPVCFADL